MKILVFMIPFFIVTSNLVQANESSIYTTRAWKALEEKNWNEVILITDECIDKFIQEAKQQQATLNELPTDNASDYWALNDVGTCYFIKCEALAMMGGEYEEMLIQSLKILVDELTYAQCWDSQGWYWDPASSAKKKLRQIEFQQLLDF